MYKRVERTTENGLWRIISVRSAQLSHFSGWLINTKTKAKYVFNIIDGKRIRYMKMPTEAKIPRYVDELVYDTQEELCDK